MHKCKECKYFYETMSIKTESLYNALSDQYESIVTEEKKKEACGYTAGGIFLDKESPRCSNYEEIQ